MRRTSVFELVGRAERVSDFGQGTGLARGKLGLGLNHYRFCWRQHDA